MRFFSEMDVQRGNVPEIASFEKVATTIQMFIGQNCFPSMLGAMFRGSLLKAEVFPTSDINMVVIYDCTMEDEWKVVLNNMRGIARVSRIELSVLEVPAEPVTFPGCRNYLSSLFDYQRRCEITRISKEKKPFLGDEYFVLDSTPERLDQDIYEFFRYHNHQHTHVTELCRIFEKNEINDDEKLGCVGEVADTIFCLLKMWLIAFRNGDVLYSKKEIADKSMEAFATSPDLVRLLEIFFEKIYGYQDVLNLYVLSPSDELLAERYRRILSHIHRELITVSLLILEEIKKPKYR